MNEISEQTWNEELNKLFLVKKSAQRKFYLTEHDTENIWSEEVRNCAIESQRELASQGRQLLEANGQIKLSVREYTCAVNWR